MHLTSSSAPSTPKCPFIWSFHFSQQVSGLLHFLLCLCPPTSFSHQNISLSHKLCSDFFFFNTYLPLTFVPSQAANTYDLFYSVIIPHRASPSKPTSVPFISPANISSFSLPVFSSPFIKLSSKAFLPVFIPVNWALWWTVNKNCKLTLEPVIN